MAPFCELSDPDADGCANLIEWGLGSRPLDAASKAQAPSARLEETDDGLYLTFTYREWTGAEGALYTVELSRDGETWQSGPEVTVEFGTPIDHGDGTITRRFRTASPVDDAPLMLARLRVTDGG